MPLRGSTWMYTSLAAAALSLLLFASGVLAMPVEPRTTSPSTPAAEATTQGSIRVGPARVSLESSAGAVPVGGAFGYTATVRSNQPLQYLQARLRIFSASGRMMYQKTFVEQSVPKGSRSFAFARGIGDIGLPAGVYPLELSVRVSASGSTTEAVLPGNLLVFDPEREALPVVVVARVSAQPLADPDGRFSSNPAEFTRAREDVERLCDYVILDDKARLSLALSPVMLDEWRRIAAGYRLLGAEGEIEVPPTDPVPQAYARTLDLLRQAVETKRLEVMSLGFSDPVLTELETAGLIADVAPQFITGRSAAAASLELTPSAGTAPARGALTEPTARQLAANGVGYVVMTGSSATIAKKPAPAGAYRSRRAKVRVLVSEDAIVKAGSGSSVAPLLTSALRHTLKRRGACLPLLFEVGPQAQSADAVIAAGRALESQQWATLTTARAAVSRKKLPDIRLVGLKADEKTPRDYWRTVANARKWSRALTFALPDGATESRSTEIDSLIAEGSAWRGVDGEWLPAGRGLTFAAASIRRAEGILGGLELSVPSVTLAGASGNVPVTMVNGTDRPLRVSLQVSPGRSVKINGPRSRTLTLPPGERFAEIPVELTNVLAGEVRVSLAADEVPLASTTVQVRASYLDRLAMIAGVLVLLGGILVFIITRVRAADSLDVSPIRGRRR